MQYIVYNILKVNLQKTGFWGQTWGLGKKNGQRMAVHKKYVVAKPGFLLRLSIAVF